MFSSSSRPHRPHRRALAAGGVVAAATTLVGLSSGPASAYSDPPGTTIQARGGIVTAAVGGFLDGLVYQDKASYPANTSNKWDQSSEHYTGPGGRAYYTFRFKGSSNKCLSHTAAGNLDLLQIEPCVWSDNDQWWSVESFTSSTPCSPQPFCQPPRWAVMSSWSAPTKAVTDYDGTLLTLQPRVGTTGSAGQRLNLYHVPAPPW